MMKTTFILFTALVSVSSVAQEIPGDSDGRGRRTTSNFSNENKIEESDCALLRGEKAHYRIQVSKDVPEMQYTGPAGSLQMSGRGIIQNAELKLSQTSLDWIKAKYNFDHSVTVQSIDVSLVEGGVAVKLHFSNQMKSDEILFQTQE